MLYFRLLIIGVLAVCTLGRVPNVQADIAPPEQAPGSNISPETTTKVQMVAEQVEFDLQPLNTGLQDYVAVTAEFIMLNRGLVDESLNVRFPLEAGKYTGILEPIDDFQAYVSGVPAIVTISQAEVVNCPLTDCPPERWANFPVEFPFQQYIVIRVTYKLQTQRVSNALGNFSYILKTGAGWYGPISKASIILRLPYQATRDNAQGSWNADVTPEYRYNEVRWYAEAIEPRSNMSFSVIYPEIWRQLLTAQAKTKTNPKDPNVWAQLGEAYLRVGQLFHGTWDVRQLRLSLQAHTQAARLDPLNSERYATMARMRWLMETRDDPAACDLSENRFNLQTILPNLSLALALDPNNSSALSLLSEIRVCTNQEIKLPAPNAQIMALLEKTKSTPTP